MNVDLAPLTVAIFFSVPADVPRSTWYDVMGEPPLSGGVQERLTVVAPRVPWRYGAPGLAGSAGSNCARRVLPPVWRATRWYATKSFRVGSAMQAAVTQPSS